MWHKTHDQLFKAIVLAAISVLLSLFAVLPIYRNLRKIQAKLVIRTKELNELNSKVLILSKLDKNILAQRVKTMDQALPPNKDVLLYLASIDGLSRELGLTLGGISLTPGALKVATGSEVVEKSSKALQTLATDVSIKGNKESIYTFLRTIESVLPLMQIKDISVDVSEADNYTLSLSLGMLWASPTTSSVVGAVTLFGEEEDKYFTQLSNFRKFEQLSLPTTSIVEVKKDIFSKTEIIPQQ